MIKALKLLWVILVVVMIIGKPPEAGASSDVEVKWEYRASSDIQWLDHWEDGFSTGDLNGDGRLDLVVAKNLRDEVSILINNGDGTFQAAVDFTVKNGPSCVTVSDLDGNGKLDLAVTKQHSNNVSILLSFMDGDINGDLDVNLEDAILAFQSLGACRFTSQKIKSDTSFKWSCSLNKN